MKVNIERKALISLRRELSTLDNNSTELIELSKLYSVLNTFESFEKDEEYLRFQVFSIIAFHSGVEINEIDENQNLKFDLGINNSEKWIFKKRFNELINELGGKIFVTKAECLKCEFVEDCLKLVKSKLK